MDKRRSEATPVFDRVSDYARYYAERDPDAEALALGDVVWTYKELADEIDLVAGALIASGVKRGDRVATLSTPHPQYFITFLAASSIGAIWLGLNPRYQVDEYRYVLGDSEPCFLFARTQIADRSYAHELEILQSEISSLRDIVLLDDENSRAPGVSYAAFRERANSVSQEALAEARNKVSPGDTALIVYTSGSTGRPKGAMLPHRGLVKCSRVQLDYWGCDPLRVLNYAPINHVGCVGDMSCFCLVAGGRMAFMEKFNPVEALERIEREKITWFLAVPTVLQMMLMEPAAERYDLSSLQIVAWSGAAAPRHLVEQLLERFPKISSSYGLTETVGSVTYAQTADGADILAGTIGFPVPDFEVAVMQEDGRLAAPGEEGEVVVRGDFVMNGYWRRIEATQETFDAESWLHTGDVGVAQPDGAIRLVGRKKEMFISGGYNVYPREIENAIESHPGVAAAAVIPMPDDLYGEVGCAFILKEADSSLSQGELSDYSRTKLANYKVPKRFIIEDELPMLPIGKVDKNQLKSRVPQLVK